MYMFMLNVQSMFTKSRRSAKVSSSKFNEELETSPRSMNTNFKIEGMVQTPSQPEYFQAQWSSSQDRVE